MTSPHSPYPPGGHGPGPSYYHQPSPVYGPSSPGPNPHYAYQYHPPPPPHHHPGPSRPNGRGGGPYSPRNQTHNPYAYYPPYGHHPGPIPMHAPNPHPYPRNQPYSPSYAYLNPAAVPFTPPRHTPQPMSPNVSKQRPAIPQNNSGFYEPAPAQIPIMSPRAQKPSAPPPQPETETHVPQLEASTSAEPQPSFEASPPEQEPSPQPASPSPAPEAPSQSSSAYNQMGSIDDSPSSEPPSISFAIWSRRPRDPSHAPGIIISPRACPPPKVVDGALTSKTPPISPSSSPVATKKKLPPSDSLDAVTTSQTSSTVPSSSVTESASTPTIPGSPATTNTSISTSAGPVVIEAQPEPKEPVPTASREEESVAGASVEKPVEEAPAPPTETPTTPAPEPAPSVPAVKKSWASLLRPAGATPSSAKNALPTSSIVGFSIPADAPSTTPVSPTKKSELVNLLMSPPSTTAFAPKIRPRGLVNSGNMCFANSVLQILVYCPPFHRLFVDLGKVLPTVAAASEKEREKEREREWAGLPTAANGTGSSTGSSSPALKPSASAIPLVDATALFLKEFLDKKKSKDSTKSGGGAFSRAGKGKEREFVEDDEWDMDSFLPTYIYDAMKEKKRFDSMRGGQQEDAEEFLGFYLDTLEEELLHLLNSVNAAQPEKPSVDEKEVPATKEDGWLEVGKKNRTMVTRTIKATESPITRIFGGKFRSTLRAPRQKDSVVVEDWRSLRLDIQPEGIHTIQDALSYISHPQHVQLSIPTQPGVPVEATQQVLIESLPPILVLHIKRFHYDMNAKGVVKIGKQVTFEPELVIGADLMAPVAKKTTSGPNRYKLFGALYHHGLSASGGHYTLDVLHPNRYPNLPPVPTTAAGAVSGPAGLTRGREGWVRIDDDLVSDVRHEDVFGAVQERDDGRSAYLLFYKRV